jgi:hypothetical protein
VTAATVREAASEIRDARPRPWRWVAAAATTALVIATGIFGWRWHVSGSVASPVGFESRVVPGLPATSAAGDGVGREPGSES